MKYYLIAFLFLLAAGVYAADVAVSRNAHMLRILQLVYKENNRAFFGGKLTEDTVITIVPELRDDHGERIMGSTQCSSDDGGLHCDVRIDAGYNQVQATAVLTLDHEMCHIKLWGKEFQQHGTAWQACMQEGAAMGEFHDVW